MALNEKFKNCFETDLNAVQFSGILQILPSGFAKWLNFAGVEISYIPNFNPSIVQICVHLCP